MTEQQWRDAFDWLVDRAERGGVPMETPEGLDMDVADAVIDWLRSLRYPVPPELVAVTTERQEGGEG